MAALSKVQAARCAGVEERRNETLPRNGPRQRLGQAEREYSGKVHRDCRQSEKDCDAVEGQGAGGSKSRYKTKKIFTTSSAKWMPRDYCARFAGKQGEYPSVLLDILPVFSRMCLIPEIRTQIWCLFQWF